ncbi:MAG: hypothetical protein OHK0029_05190 [Armatimonadaceae bacterium]
MNRLFRIVLRNFLSVLVLGVLFGIALMTFAQTPVEPPKLPAGSWELPGMDEMLGTTGKKQVATSDEFFLYRIRDGKAGPLIRVSDADRKILRKLLLDPNFYVGPVTSCMPKPGIGLQVGKGDNAVKLEFCFDCRKLVSSQSKRWGSFSAQTELVALMKRAFPKDPVVQKLKANELKRIGL